MQPETSGLRVAVGVTPDPAWLSGDPTTTAPFWILSCLLCFHGVDRPLGWHWVVRPAE